MSPQVPAPKPTFFATPADWRAWLARHHAHRTELWVGYWKKGEGRPSITWPESVDEALCYGWIDGLRRAHDARSYVIRFTPRKPTSVWSRRNTDRFLALAKAGRVRAAGRKAFAARREGRSGVYSFEQPRVALPAAYARRFRADPGAWAYFRAAAPWYRRAATWWVVSAKRADTRERRLATLVADSAAGRRIALLRGRPVKP